MRSIYQMLKGIIQKPAFHSQHGHIYHTRAGLLDIDINLHLNNASLIFAAELARWNFLGSVGLIPHAMKHRWMFMVGSQAVRYRHEIKAFDPYVVKTQVVALDETWLWLRHTMHSKNRICAHVLVRVIVKKGKDTVSPKELMELVGVDVNEFPKPSDSKEVMGFCEWDGDVAIQMKNDKSNLS
jgi:acyl-CoA thioesterase FadM